MDDLKDSGKLQPFEPKKVAGGKVEIKPFQPKSLNGTGISDYHEVKKKFGSLSTLDQGSGVPFNLHPASKRFLGVEKQEKDHLEGVVQAEVESRIANIRDSAYQEGLELGRKEGFSIAENEYRESVRPLQERLSQMLVSFDGIKKDLMVANEAFLVQLVFQVSRQIMLRELGADRDYVKRLVSHVVEKLGAKDHIRVRVSRKDAENIESIKDFLKAEIPDLRNVQIEGSDEIQLGGCKVETDLSRINATLENQLAAIEKALGEA